MALCTFEAWLPRVARRHSGGAWDAQLGLLFMLFMKTNFKGQYYHTGIKVGLRCGWVKNLPHENEDAVKTRPKE